MPMNVWGESPDEAIRADTARRALHIATGGPTRARMPVRDDGQGYERTFPYGAPLNAPRVASTPLYEPSQPAPKASKALYGLLLILAGVVMVVEGVRRMRPESKIVALCVVIGAVLVVAGRVA
jgi:hypothetical protein